MYGAQDLPLEKQFLGLSGSQEELVENKNPEVYNKTSR